MRIYIEALLLFIIIFFSGPQTAAEGFSVTAELQKIFLYSVPSIALIWFMILRVKQVKDCKIKPCKNDIISCLIAFPCLLIIGFAAAFSSSYFGETLMRMPARSPSTAAGWAILSLSCIFAAYLEESFFRFYFLARRDELKLNAVSAVFFSAVLFSICHIYEGPWGFLNSLFSAVILAFIYLRFQSLHGIAFAHGFYNITAFILTQPA
ncbi:MAG: CPBP family intramembrane metalloprotease [Treponema sp.]|nr:CPBP family intramembrane metalloprotease [Treponema sp.]MCL2271432.1 CPBP family intramembrane metalloprotease [Treponema sp.]